MPSGISWVAGTTSAFVTSATSIASSTPAGIQNNDGLFAFVFARSTLTPPSGWTLVASQATTSSPTTQTLYVYRKNTVASTDSSTSFTWTQASANRMGVTYAVARASGGSLRVAGGIGTNVINTSGGDTIAAPGYYASRASELVLMAVTVISNTASSFAQTPPSGSTLWSGTVADNRLGGAYQVRNEGQVAGSANWTASSGASSNGLAAITLGLYDSRVEDALTDNFQYVDYIGNRYTDSLTDASSFSEASATAYAGTMVESIASTEAFASLWRLCPTVTENGTVADVMVPNWGVILNEALRFVDATNPKLTYGTSASDVVRIAEILSGGRLISATDSVGVAVVMSSAVGAQVAERLGLVEVLAPKATYGLVSTDRVRVSDSVLRFLGGGVVEGLGISDGITPLYYINRTLTDGVQISETVAPRLLLRVTASESVAIDDTQAIKMLFNPTVVDGVEITAAYISPNGQFTTWAVNTNKGFVSEYTNYEFNSFASIGRKYIGAASTGLYELNGDDDAGQAIVAAIKGGYFQFGGARLSSFKAIYLGVRGEGDFVLRLETGDGKTYNYAVTVESLKTAKINVGKGIRSRYFSYELVSTGQDFDLESIEFLPIVANRRV